ncbi:ROK family transcriptional regulator [Jiangella anatolica]|uniref:ROK family transcriptional regulator n=2 Tax=Jiangella anatolica TaxID=2670374 RepID=A0A2W2AXT8_9ACTN|nr:ROK family transcriptional regulator [Jiangella anatolica]
MGMELGRPASVADRTVAVGTSFMLEVNASAILTNLRSVGRASVSSLAKQTGLSRQAVSRSLAVLTSMGLVEISAPDRAASPAGRPPQMVRFRSEAGHVLGVDVKARRVRVAVADLAAEIVAESTVPLDGSVAFAEWLRTVVLDVLDQAGIGPDDVWHVSVAAPGIIDPATGHVALSPGMPEIVGDGILLGIRSAVDAPVYLDNAIKLATIGERWRGAPHAEQSLVFVHWGERIGAGILIHGELYRGASNDAGDLGYLEIGLPDTPDGTDADLGPFERSVGTRELLRIAGSSAERPSSETLTLTELAAAVCSRQPWALSAVRTISSRFARGIAVLRSLLDPEVIVIGGDITELGQALLDSLDDALRFETLEQPQLEFSTLGADAIVQGGIHQSLRWVEQERFGVTAVREGSSAAGWPRTP